VLYFALIGSNGCPYADGCIGSGVLPTQPLDAENRPIFQIQPLANYWMVIEAKPGPNGQAVGHSVPPVPTPPAVLTTRPDLQIITSNNMGDGSAAICDTGSSGHGIPASPDFGPTQAVTDALTDFACRFSPATTSGAACTIQPNGESFPGMFVNPNTTVQFCYLASSTAAFPLGDTILTLQLQDSTTAHTLGAQAQIVVRVQ
jgi:hypothetical protein